MGAMEDDIPAEGKPEVDNLEVEIQEAALRLEGEVVRASSSQVADYLDDFHCLDARASWSLVADYLDDFHCLAARASWSLVVDYLDDFHYLAARANSSLVGDCCCFQAGMAIGLAFRFAVTLIRVCTNLVKRVFAANPKDSDL